MMRAVLVVAALAASAGEARRRPPATYTRAALAGLTTAELAQRLFGPEVAAVATGHVVDPPAVPGGPLEAVSFDVPPRPIGPDLCRQDRPSAYFNPIARKRVVPPGDAPSRISFTSRHERLAVAPNCRMVPGQRFAKPIIGLPLEKSVAVLRSLNAARSAAAGPGPLPFKLTCVDSRSRKGSKCGNDPRAALASLPLFEAFRIDRRRYQDDVHIVNIGDPAGVDEDLPYWEVELRAMGSKQAEIRMAWTVRTLI